jgi:ribosomal protein L11
MIREIPNPSLPPELQQLDINISEYVNKANDRKNKYYIGQLLGEDPLVDWMQNTL